MNIDEGIIFHFAGPSYAPTSNTASHDTVTISMSMRLRLPVFQNANYLT